MGRVTDPTLLTLSDANRRNMGQSTRMTAAVYLRDDMETPALPRHTATGQMLWQRSHPDGAVLALVFKARDTAV